jgi:hypothetical protein
MVDHKLPQLKRLAFVTWIHPVNSKLFHLCDITLDVWMRYAQNFDFSIVSKIDKYGVLNNIAIISFVYKYILVENSGQVAYGDHFMCKMSSILFTPCIFKRKQSCHMCPEYDRTMHLVFVYLTGC